MVKTSKPVIHCDALVVHCMDYRLQKFLQPWITVRFGYDNFDIISLAGAVHDYEMVLKYVQLAVQVHNIETVCLVNHEDCRAYGRDGTYKRHTHDLTEAQKKIKALFPDLKVETFFLHLDGTFEPIS
jgi:carbonic anhydrase